MDLLRYEVEVVLELMLEGVVEEAFLLRRRTSLVMEKLMSWEETVPVRVVLEALVVVFLLMFASGISMPVFSRLMEEVGKSTLLLAQFMSRKLHVDPSMLI